MICIRYSKRLPARLVTGKPVCMGVDSMFVHVFCVACMSVVYMFAVHIVHGVYAYLWHVGV
jgi:hypothetical protein